MENIKTDTLLDRLNSPDVSGIIPGSLRVREDVRRIDSKLQTGQQFNFDASSLSLEGALVGSKCELVVVASAKLSNGNNITNEDIKLVEEASNIIWRDLTLIVNGQEITHSVRADIVRHIVDRYNHASHEYVKSHASYRQLNSDYEFTAPANNVFNKDMIKNGNRFELVRPLDDLPFFAEEDSLIPGFNTVQIRALTTSDPQALFKCSTSITASPYLQIEEVKLRYVTVKLETVIAQELQSMSAAGELEMTGSLWSAVNLTPRIDNGARRWVQGVATAFGTVPDIVYFMTFPEVSFIPTLNSYKSTTHPLDHSWSGISATQFTNGGGEEVANYRDLEQVGGKIKLISALKNSGVDDGNIDPAVFVSDPGLGVVPMYMRDRNETDTNQATPMTLRILADLNDGGASESAQPYLVSKSRHRWILSITPGATKLIQ